MTNVAGINGVHDIRAPPLFNAPLTRDSARRFIEDLAELCRLPDPTLLPHATWAKCSAVQGELLLREFGELYPGELGEGDHPSDVPAGHAGGGRASR